MRNKRRTALTVMLALLLGAGCTQERNEVTQVHVEQKQEELPEAALPESYTTILAGKKDEEITVKADASGKPETIAAEVRLSEIEGSGYVRDCTSLANLRNTEGGEEWFELGDGEILWEYEGKPIRYKGTGTGPLPFGVRLTYQLDGKPATPEQLAGKSGHVVIRIDYENRTSKEQVIDGVTYQLPVPVLAVTMIPLSDHFHNVKTENGSIVRLSDTNAVLAMALPGMQDALKLKQYELTEEMELPEYALVEADVEDFELEFTTTVFVSDLLDGFEDDLFQDADEMTSDMNKLKDASDKLVDGTDTLYSGMKEFEGYLRQYNDGLGQLNQGVNALKDAMGTLNGYSCDMKDGIRTLNSGLTQLNAAMAGFDTDTLLPGEVTPEQAEFMRRLEEAKNDLPREIALMTQSLTLLCEQYPKMMEFSQEAGEYQTHVNEAVTLLEALKTGMPVLFTEEQIAVMKEALSTEEEKALLDEWVRYDQLLAEKLEEIKNKLPDHAPSPEFDLAKTADAIAAFGTALETASGELALIGIYSETVQKAVGELDGLSEKVNALKGGIAKLAEGSDALKSGFDAYADGVYQVYEGMVKLSEGTGQIPEAGNALNDGYAKILDGTGSLSDAMRTFDQDGIREITKLAGSSFQDLVHRADALREISGTFDNWYGITEGTEGSVVILIETEAIKEN